MKKVFIILLIFPVLLFSQTGPGTGQCLSSLSFGDPSSYTAPDCGRINASQWTVTNDSCTMGTAPVTISLGLDSVDVTICGRVNPSGNLEADDRAYLKYTVDGVQTTWDTIPGNRFTKVTELCIAIRVRVGAIVSAEVTYVNNHNSEDWRLQDGGIGVCYTIPVSLPVNLLDFTASLNNNEVMVEWSTASEINNNYFKVERSIDGINFYEIDRVDGVGNSNENNYYTSIDETPNKGLSYYRLIQVDYDGNFEIHTVVAVTNNAKQNFNEYVKVYPNPVNNTHDIHLEIEGYESEKILCSLINAFGQELYSFVVLSETNRNYIINSSDLNLNPGVYFVKGSTNGNLFSQKIVVQ